ncbi:MAG: amino acid ABC transporter permease [Micrococcales bacterium]|nr:amino acid ABC transporter permease [Micrococcales bacterium]
MMRSADVLFDIPGPKARRTQSIVGGILTLAAAALGAFVIWQFAKKGQFEGAKWSPFLTGEIWQYYILPGLIGTLKAAVVSVALAAVFGLVFGMGRLSDIAPVRWASGVIVELFRAVPVLVMMIFFFNVYLLSGMFPSQEAFAGVVTALTLYNGSVVAELVRSGVDNLPRGQREAGLSIGLTGGQTLRSIMLPQALTAMLPAIMSQLVVVLKDSALGYAITYEELLNKANQIGSYKGNLIPAFIVIAVIFIAMNFALTTLAQRIEQRLRRRGHTAGLAPQPTADEFETGAIADAESGRTL